jgi:Transposase domain (DUF772)
VQPGVHVAQRAPSPCALRLARPPDLLLPLGCSGSASYHPSVLLSILVYGYATGVFSSRKLERATYDSVAFRFIAGNEHPDHDTIASFRRRFLKQIEGLFVEVLKLAREMGVLKLGTVAFGQSTNPVPGLRDRIARPFAPYGQQIGFRRPAVT